MQDPTNPTTAKLATTERALPLRRRVLIGVVGPEGAMRALVRAANGDVRVVGVGDQLGNGTVVAIGMEHGVTVASAHGQERLHMPQPVTRTHDAA